MSFKVLLTACLTTLLCARDTVTAFNTKKFDCGPYGFICEGAHRLRICEGINLLGPAFICPPNTHCNEDSSDVCQNAVNYVEPAISKTIYCHKNERIIDPTVPDCKGYILCIPNKNRFQGIKFKCGGNTIFNGYTRTCTAPEKYKCPVTNATKPSIELFGNENKRVDSNTDTRLHPQTSPHRSIECKNYKFSVTDDNGPVRATYFCPPRPIWGETSVRCTVFSSKFCITLERDDGDQSVNNAGAAYRKPRIL
ncbi:uncharacterized protein LOC113523337 [Galleria mellonella]|uniref:Uncharacterized protein LOC113523337 n=1 Tax=Galleria mellonella TaxID=7137 RepID=A0A6J1X591_GALME|nr:uncharacterized protein LOC113523337 [Galleria mellonella]